MTPCGQGSVSDSHGDYSVDVPAIPFCGVTLQRKNVGAYIFIAKRSTDPPNPFFDRVAYRERTLAWLGQYRRLAVRSERLGELHLAFLTLACALICWRRLRRAFPEQ